MRKIGTGIHFLNVDLEVRSDRELQPLVEAFGETVRSHLSRDEASGANLATLGVALSTEEILELAEKKRGDGGEIEAKILKFCALIRGLEGQAKELWETASRKTFDLGYDSGFYPHAYISEISAETVAKMVEVGAALKVTIYCVDLREADANAFR